MPRTEHLIMNDWKFTLGDPETSTFQSVTLPHDWAVGAPFNRYMDQGIQQGFRDRWGIGWYRRSLYLDEKKPGYHYFLEFGGIYENSTIWVNEQEAGRHLYGYSSFRLDISKLIRTGDNTILVKVDNTVRPVDRWYSGCGIYRTVKLVEVEALHFDPWEIVVTTQLDGADGIVHIHTGMESIEGHHVKVSCSLADIKGQVLAEAESAGGTMTMRIKNALFWTAETPYLYGLTVMLVEGSYIHDKVTMRVGIREIEMVSSKGMLVNGLPVKLKGVCLHQDVGCRGIAATKRLMRKRLESLKHIGCNCIRTAHHTHSEEFLDLCDEMGFYVYEECFDKWTGGLYGRYFETQWQQDVDAMVKRDRNRACIVIWGVGNEVENQGQESMLRLLKMLRDYVLALDHTRAVTYAMNPHFKRESDIDVSKVTDIQKFVDEEDDAEIYDAIERVERIRKIAEIVDVISCNYVDPWYELIHEYVPDKLILGTEVYPFFKSHINQTKNYSNENPNLVPFQCEYCIGGFVWAGYDYLGESSGYPAKSWGGSLIRTNGEARASYYILKSYWKKEPMVHFSVMDYSLMDEGVKGHWDMPIYADHWHFPQFHQAMIPYMVASNCDEVAIYVNGRRHYVPRPADCSNRLITGFLPYEPGVVKVVGYMEAKEVCYHETVTPGPAVKLEFDNPYTVVKTDDAENFEILLTVRAKDCHGHPYFRESSSVRFVVEGDAEILAVDNGNPMGSEPYDASYMHMYHGCVSVVIRLAGMPGKITVRGFADGLYSGSAYIEVKDSLVLE